MANFLYDVNNILHKTRTVLFYLFSKYYALRQCQHNKVLLTTHSTLRNWQQTAMKRESRNEFVFKYNHKTWSDLDESRQKRKFDISINPNQNPSHSCLLNTWQTGFFTDINFSSYCSLLQ